MQTLNNIPTDYAVTRWFAPIFEAYSVKELPRRLNIPRRLRRCLNIVHRAAKSPLLGGTDVECRPIDLPRPKANEHPKAIVAFSGGKDCLAAAIRAEADGYQPILIHVKGINMSLPSARKHAEALAKKMGYPYKEVKINFTGKKEYNEHPLRNLLILCLLIDEGIKFGARTYVLGNVFEDDTSHANLDYDLSDGIDILRAFEYFIAGVIDGFKLKTYMCNTLQSFYTIWQRDSSLIPLLHTCCTPDFRKPMIRKHSVEKYGEAVLSQTGCGGCYKCATEYTYKKKFGMIKGTAAYDRRAMELINKFKAIHRGDFVFDKRQYNRYGGKDTTDVQVLCDRVGYYIGRLEYNTRLFKWFTRDAFGHRHYQNREIAQAILERFVNLYKLK